MIESHEYKCRHLVIPIQIVDLVEKEVISVKQAWLTGIIDALVECKGVGCYASFAWLAKRVQVKERQVRNLVEDLVVKGILIECKGKDGRKMLETKWSRAAEIEEIIQTHRNTLQPTIAKNCDPKSQKIATYNNVSINSNLSDAPRSHPTAPTTVEDVSDNIHDDSTDKDVDIEAFKSRFIKPPQSSPFSHEMTKTLYEGLKRLDRIHKNPNFVEWRVSFDKLAKLLLTTSPFTGKQIDDVYVYIREMVKYHLDHLRDQFHPVLDSGVSFCDRFIKLEDARNRRLQDEQAKKDKNKQIGW